MNEKINIERATPKGFIINEYDEYLQITKKWLGRKTIVGDCNKICVIAYH